MKKYIICCSAFLIIAFQCVASEKVPFEFKMQYGTNFYVETMTAEALSKSPSWDGNTNSLPLSRNTAESNAISYAKSKLKNSDAWTIHRRFLKPFGGNKWVYAFVLSTPEEKLHSPSGFVPPVLIVVLLNGDVVPAILNDRLTWPDVLNEWNLDHGIEFRDR
jgi:hypothetical protein